MIASYMDVKQWAKTSGLCKTTWKLQLDSIELSPYDVTEMPGEQHIVMSYFYAQSIYKSAQYAGQGIADTAAAVICENFTQIVLLSSSFCRLKS